MTREHRVLVVGAGPCGLMAACELRRRGVAADVVEAAPEPQRGSRAILLWPPTLRQYRDVGILAAAERRGAPIRALTYYTDPRRAMRIALPPEMAPLVLPQQDTDELLEAELHRLGGAVERGLTLCSLEPDGDAVRVELRRTDGQLEPRRAGWLIGADGVGSTTRGLLGIEFAGARLPTTFLLAEGRLTGDYDREAIHYFLNPRGVLLIAPLPGGRVRISAPLPEGDEATADVTDDAAQRMLDERGPGGLRIQDLTYHTTFTSQERISARLRAGRCFLVGDAAHTHSVVGGQGLNLGFGDARNLAWKLAGVIDGRLDPAILDSYDVERRAAAEQVVRTTARMARQAVLGPVRTWMRNRMFSMAHRTGVLARVLPPMLTGWAIHYPAQYPAALLPPGPRRRTGALPRAGTQSPAWPVETDRFELVTLGPEDAPHRAPAAALARAHDALVSHRHVVAAKPGFLLLRPDGFVAASGGNADLGPLGDAIARLAGSTKELRA